MRIRAAESLRVPEQGSSSQGESGPKPRPKGVGDGQPVDIPVPVWTVTSDGVTQRGRRSGPLVVPVQACKGAGRQIPRQMSEARVRGNYSTEVAEPGLPGKASSQGHTARTANRHRWAVREAQGARENPC